MKYYERLPDGTEVEIEIEPMPEWKFHAICFTICAVLFIVGLFLAIILRR